MCWINYNLSFTILNHITSPQLCSSGLDYIATSDDNFMKQEGSDLQNIHSYARQIEGCFVTDKQQAYNVCYTVPDGVQSSAQVSKV